MLVDVLRIFYPDLCINCREVLYKNENVLCVICRNTLPIAIHDNHNKIANLFFGKIKVEKIVALIYFNRNGLGQELVHHLKYKNRQDIGVFIADYFADMIKEKIDIRNVDFIVPVPLHKIRLRERGYNQVTTFGKTLSDVLKVPYCPNNLIRIKANKSQTKKKRYTRFKDAQDLFEIKDLKLFENKHVLLIDDVVTTGATLLSCCNTLYQTKNINISIVTIAFTMSN